MSSLIGVDPPLSEVVIEAGDHTLRPFRPSDLELVEHASADPSITSITTVPSTWTREAGLAFIERQGDRLRTGAGWSLAIAERPSDRAVGQIGLWLADLAKGRATIGYWVAPSARRRGAAASAVRGISTWAFEHLDVDRLTLYIAPSNDASIATARRAGFQREALLRDWERIDGSPRDMLSFARCRRDTSTRRSETLR